MSYLKFDYTEHKKRDWTYYATYLNRFKTKPQKILEMGCGIGLFLEACRENGIEALGLEYEEEGVKHALQKGLNARKHDLINKISFIGDNSYDAVFSNQVIEHLVPEAQINMLNEAYRVLKPGGELLVNSPCRHFEQARKDKYHIGLLTPSELKDMAANAGFSNINMGYNRPQKVNPVPDSVINDIWIKYMPDLLSQTATVLAVK